MLKETRLIKIGLGIAATMTAFCVHAANGQPLPAPKVNALTQKVWDNPDVTEQSKGIRTLQDYIVQEKGLHIRESPDLCYLRQRRTCYRYSGDFYPRF